MDDFFKNNPNLFGNNININNKYNSFKGRQKININNNNNQFSNTKNQNQNRYSVKNIKDNPRENIQNKNKSFIIGKFGKKTVVSQDLDTFLNKIKQAEWTTNPSYLIAKDINVKPIFIKNNNIDNDNNITKYSNNIDKLYLHLNEINTNDFLNYINEITNRKNKFDDKEKKEKEEFLKSNFYNQEKLNLNAILNRIRNNHMNFISKDQILYNKIYQTLNN